MAKKDSVELLKRRVAKLEAEKEELIEANKQMGMALDAILAEVIRKYGINDSSGVSLQIPIPAVSAHDKVSAQKADDVYTLRLEVEKNEGTVGD